jgi:hypothetical protein
MQKHICLLLTEGAQVKILVPCNSTNPCLPSSMLVMPIITESSSKTPCTHFQSMHASATSTQVYVCLLMFLAIIYEFIPSHSPVNGCTSGETTALPAFIYSGLIRSNMQLTSLKLKSNKEQQILFSRGGTGYSPGNTKKKRL